MESAGHAGDRVCPVLRATALPPAARVAQGQLSKFYLLRLSAAVSAHSGEVGEVKGGQGERVAQAGSVFHGLLAVNTGHR